MALLSQYGKRDEIFGFQTLYREIGYYINRIEQYERSLKFFDEAIKKTPDDKRALIGRSIARAKAIQYEGALKDINKALGLDPDDLRALAEKALNTYLCCEFEEGLVQNSRLTPIRQKPENFLHGVWHCKDAIENCVGERTGRPLRDHFQIIRRLAWKKNYAAQKPFVPIPKMNKKNNKVSKLKKLVMNEDLQEPVQPKKHKLQLLREVSEGGLQLYIRDSLHSKEADDEPIPPFSDPFPYKPLQNYTSNIENFMAEKYLDSMCLDKIFLKKFATEPGTSCPNERGSKKIKHIAKSCYKTVCKAFYDIYRIDEEAHFIEHYRRLYALMGLPLSRDPSTDSVIGNFRHVYLDHRKLIREFEQRLINAVLPDEICWFYHELSRYHIEIKKYGLARIYARKCIQEAKILGKYRTEGNDQRWMLNATMLIIKCHLQQHNKNDAKNSLDDALKIASALHDQAMYTYVQTFQEVVIQMQFDDVYGPKQLKERESMIVNLMPQANLKDEAAYLFKQMDAMPSARRMTVIPGLTLTDTKRKTRRSRAMSIMPETKRSLIERASSAQQLQKSDQKKADKGSEFMNFVEFHVQ